MSVKIKLMCSISDGPDWVYANGHNLDRESFLAAVKVFIDKEYGEFGPRDEPVTAADIRETWFKRMSPTEARQLGVDSGVWLQSSADGHAYPVTLVEV